MGKPFTPFHLSGNYDLIVIDESVFYLEVCENGEDESQKTAARLRIICFFSPSKARFIFTNNRDAPSPKQLIEK